MKNCRILTFVLLLAVVFSCEKEREYPWNPEWDKYDEDENVVTPPADTLPDAPAGPEFPVDPEGAKARFIWIDAAANFKDYANDKAKIAEDMARIRMTGFTAVVVDVRPTNSGVLFRSDVEKALTRVDRWEGGTYYWETRTADFDYLQAFIDAGKEVGLDVYASINTMIGGCYCDYDLGEDGILYDNDRQKKDWATVVNTSKGLKNSLELDGLSAEELEGLGLSAKRAYGARFLNPANDEVVGYLLDLLGELAAYEGLDGIILDRCRYDDTELMSDFSDVSKTKFEAYIGAEEPIADWPDAVFAPGVSNMYTPTPMQVKWMEFRAKMIHDFVEAASAKVHSINQDIRFGAYVGAWYSTYYRSGVNWASPNTTSPYLYSWATPEYRSYGYADHCDIMIIGAYAGPESITGTNEWTMQGFCDRAESLFAGDVPYVGGPDIGNSGNFAYGGQGDKMSDIVDVCISSCTEGMFMFDLCHIKMHDYWNDIKLAMDHYRETLK